MHDDILDFVGFEFVTSHIGKAKRTSIPSNDHILKDSKFRFLEDLNVLCQQVIDQDFKPNEDLKDKLMDQVFKVKDEYKKVFPDYANFLVCTSLVKGPYLTFTFVRAKTEKQALGHLKSYGLTDGTVYGNQDIPKDAFVTMGVRYVIQLSFKSSCLYLRYILLKNMIKYFS